MGVCGLACGQRVEESWESIRYNLFVALHPMGFRTATWPMPSGCLCARKWQHVGVHVPKCTYSIGIPPAKALR